MPEPSSAVSSASSPLVAQLRKQFRETPLYCIVDTAVRPDLSAIAILDALLAGGGRVVQYRHKGRFGRRNFDDCCAMAEKIHDVGGLFIVNDRADVAALCGSDGIHLGQQDLPPAKARAVLGAGKVIGYSTHNIQQAALAAALPINYIAVGPVFSTQTKQNPDPVVGLSLVSEVRAKVAIPVVAIGGITLENAASVISAGANAVAAAGDLLRASDIEQRARQFLAALRTGF